MTSNLTIGSNYRGYIDYLSTQRTAYQKYANQEIKSMEDGKEISFRCPDGTYVSKNVSEQVTVGTLAECISGNVDITNEVANAFVNLNWGIEN